MANRRRPGEALTPEERAIIDDGARKPARPPASQTEAKQSTEPASSTASQKTDMPASKKADKPETPNKPLSTRVTPSLYKRLQRVASDRKIEETEPYSVQDIVAAALEAWLAEHGEK